MGFRGGISQSQDAGVRAPSRWSDAATWEGEGLRREVFFFHSGGTKLYGSLYAAAELSRPFGLVACGSWGVEADRCDPLVRSVALAMARLGGAGLVFHYPGYGDSYGELADLDLADLSSAAADAFEEAARRRPDIAWFFAGFMLGASVACLAQRRMATKLLLLVQPALEPGSYFQWLAHRTTGLTVGTGASGETMAADVGAGMAYGYPIPGRIADSAEAADKAVVTALQAFEGEGAVIRHTKPQGADLVPDRFQRVSVPGTWRFGSQNNPKLASTTIDWLDGCIRDGGR